MTKKPTDIDAKTKGKIKPTKTAGPGILSTLIDKPQTGLWNPARCPKGALRFKRTDVPICHSKGRNNLIALCLFYLPACS